MATRLVGEQAVRAAWRSLPYHGYCICIGCGKPANCCGANPASRVCVICFEFTFNCKAPRRR